MLVIIKVYEFDVGVLFQSNMVIFTMKEEKKRKKK